MTTDIATLFMRDPADLTKDDRDLIIQKMREARHLFNTEGVTQKKAAPKLTEKEKATQGLKLDLKDIGL